MKHFIPVTNFHLRMGKTKSHIDCPIAKALRDSVIGANHDVVVYQSDTIINESYFVHSDKLRKLINEIDEISARKSIVDYIQPFELVVYMENPEGRIVLREE